LWEFDIVEVFMKAGVDTLYGVTPEPKLTQGILEAEQRTGRKCITIAIPTLPLETTPAGMGNDVATYIQIYNAAGFLMQVEIDWVQRIIWEAQKPVITIKPLAAGKLPPLVGLAFSWSTIRDRDMVCIGTSTAYEAAEVVEFSQSILEHGVPCVELQKTRSKESPAGRGA
jgi:hypothetical protein